MPHALIVDDDRNFSLGLSELVAAEGFRTSIAHSLKDARSELAKSSADVTLVDLNLPDGSGLDLLPESESGETGQVILITGHASVDTAVEALRRGASDYLTKPVDFARVKAVLANISRTRELREEIGTLRGELRELGRFGLLIGGSPAMQKVYDLITKVAPTEVTVLLYGETGTGKELVAQTIHSLSRRRKDPFLPINCGAVSPNLIETELFGHERGSFTGADRLHKGYFERAERGTVFLDEITEMPVELQVRLLRLLETRQVMRVGGAQALDIDVRVIAATNVRPEEAVAKGKLREDLLYRLNVFPIHLPQLRERQDDVELLSNHFLALLNKEHGMQKHFSATAMPRLRGHGWPGSVRELKNVIHRAFIMAEEEVTFDDLPLSVTVPPSSALQVSVGTSIADVERRLILATLEQCDGDKKKAADILGVSVKTLYNRLNEFKASEKALKESADGPR